MTKEQFLNGTSFRVKGFCNYKGAPTFKYEGGSLTEENRFSSNEKVCLTSYCLNVMKVGRKGFEGFTFILNKKVKVKFKFEDLIEFVQEA